MLEIIMADEKIHTIPLRKAFRGGNRKRRAKKAINIIQEYLLRHMKAEDVKIGKSINDSVWARGIQKPPRRVRIHATLDNKICYAELIGVDIKTPSAEEVKEKEKKKKEKKEKIKEERKERKKMTIQEEMEEESGKKVELAEKPSELKQKEPAKETKEVPKEKAKEDTKKK